jgi:TfoX/Sxy family transcriptional regulator of competence genes
MPFSEKLATSIRARLSLLPNIEEKKMMGGLVFMYNDKMCVGVMNDALMCRIDPALHEAALQKPGCHTIDFIKRPGSGYILVDESVLKTKKDLDHWINLALDFNKTAKASKKKKKQ